MTGQNFRVGVIGPGGLGGASVREIGRLEGIELAALLAFSPDKNGRDAGELVGAAPLGVTATTSLDEFMQTDATTVIYTGRDYGDFAADDTIIRLLEAGTSGRPTGGRCKEGWGNAVGHRYHTRLLQRTARHADDRAQQ
ncbi:MAG: hypothetical protein P8Y58_14765 [Novosphingobium sp.]